MFILGHLREKNNKKKFHEVFGNIPIQKQPLLAFGTF